MELIIDLIATVDALQLPEFGEITKGFREEEGEENRTGLGGAAPCVVKGMRFGCSEEGGNYSARHAKIL
uniref:Uncharacterized protein n=1 Tax=Oryza sativa subsp. japonica TaxID=39947 RepID=Q6ZG73_ORYSJ|nr:hypothetical protein [Oryza sativa Japonica Group]